MNELILIISLIAEFALILLAYRFFGTSGLYGMTVFCTIVANIEVLVLVRAFGIDQTLGNILFACSFVITDILSENHGKKQANTAAWLSIFVTVAFMLISASWQFYIPAAEDTAHASMTALFRGTPRVLLASLIVCAVTHLLDVWLYHRLWAFTERKFGDPKRFLWVRNCGATLISQLVNAVLFTLLAFAGVYSLPVLIGIAASSYAVFAVTALCDTPVVYLARRMKERYALL